MLGAWSIFADPEDTVTIREGVTSYGANALFASGCSVLDPQTSIMGMSELYKNAKTQTDLDELLGEAVDTALRADKVVLCIGEHVAQSGEAASRGDITIPECQKKLLREVARVNKNLVAVLFNGRPLDIREIKSLAKAILVVWMPGTEGGNAITEVLYGKTSPSGKLPMSFPCCVGQVPVFYNEFKTGRPNDAQSKNRFLSRYLDIPNEPLYPFGYGLSYTGFTISPVRLDGNTLTQEGTLTASVTVKNTGKRRGAETVQLYIRDDAGSVVRPVRELRGFQKLWLEPEEEREIRFEITAELLKFHDIHMKYQAEPGSFTVFIGNDSRTQNQAAFTLL